ncbi:tautomerase family protein [Paraburkholderia acidisoli]|uniref:Tautomerase family protein n=1 Tax=Paraburkholderia acidisoli TaxID=2571748 RepID=A0A7Z2GJX1_9BURK|nr:tautomerase family protein [Paraburkholderia acidisoli]QGZ63086.1 tautomerase family protein [Paraburkholderia acidisoli]
MPFVRIDTVAGRYDGKQRGAISDVLYESVLEIGALENDRFQVFSEHAPHDLVFHGDYLGIRRTDGFVAIQITMNAGRTLAQKKQLIASIAAGLHERVGIRKEDVFINLLEVPRENWSFGSGVAQYAPES